MAITLSEAQKMLEAAQATADSIDVEVSICVVDPQGVPLALARMDGARFFSVDVARGKAMVSAFFGQPSGVFGERAGSPFFTALNQMNGGRLFFVQGAMPITKDGEPVGAVGVSGASAQQDEDIAKAALAAL
ncbi:MAG: heme-binding protein [Chloroflexota bacterium]